MSGETASTATAGTAATLAARATSALAAEVLAQVREYYGQTLSSSADLKTSACCCGAGALSTEVREALAFVPDEVIERSYGCGSPVPPLLAGCTVLDLGCGTGQDCFAAAHLVGAEGTVIGVDMTPEQLAVARRYEGEVARRLGYDQPNTRFLQGYIEDLTALGIADECADVLISNCVINLSPAKEQVFREIYRVLKEGGELYFADVFASRRVPPEVAADPVIRGECLGGALYWEDFRRLLARAGWADFRVVSSSQLTIDDPEIAQRLEGTTFWSRTVRAIKSPHLEDRCEQYGQTVRYRGSIPGHEEAFALDTGHRFATGETVAVCGNTAAMIAESRFAPHFEISGDRSVHYGLFDGCGDGGTDCCGDTEGESSCC